MSDIGPELPPHLWAKRKRRQEEEAKNEATADSGAKRSTSPGEGEKRRRVLGPAMPPAALDERPNEPAEAVEESDSDSEDGFGPALPMNGAKEAQHEETTEDGSGNNETAAPEEKLRRDEWMTRPPKQDDLAARMDPTKQRPRGFNTGKGARGANSSGEDSSAWHETPEQRQKRLADEMMGVSKPSSIGPRAPAKTEDDGRDEAAARRIREHAEKTRGPSLVDQHQKAKGKEAEDDPSKRAFDREKDMGSGSRIGHTQRKEMLDKAAGFSSKFAGGSYL